MVVDGEELTVEDTVMAAVCAGRLSPDLLDHGFDTYWCVTEDGHHRLLRASELCLRPASRQSSSARIGRRPGREPLAHDLAHLRAALVDRLADRGRGVVGAAEHRAASPGRCS